MKNGKNKKPDDVVDNPGLISFPHNIGSAIIKPIDRGRIAGRSMNSMYDQSKRELIQIYEQFKTLLIQANKIKERVNISEEIYLTSDMNFEPNVNDVYYLYKKTNEKNIISMISPQEWGENCPYKYIATIKLLSDYTWEILNN